MEPESKCLEYKEKVNDKFLKTVSAFANGQDGEIIFGAADDGRIVGLNDLEKAALSIENKIRDRIHPMPEYEIERDYIHELLILKVHKGERVPYFADSIAYVRYDASSIPADRITLIEMCLKSQNKTWDIETAEEQTYTFTCLKDEFKEKIGVEYSFIDQKLLTTLDLYHPSKGYTNTGMLLADFNKAPGIDMVRFGDSENEILARNILAGISVLKQFNESFDFFKLFYQKEIIDGKERREEYLIPKTAFREALVNAIVHRNYLLSQMNIQVSMFSDRIEIYSPGGLPEGITTETYFQERASNPRNPTLAWLFFRLRYVEKFGTGIQRIQRCYAPYDEKPEFYITQDFVKVVLPVIGSETKNLSLNMDEGKVLQYLKIHGFKSRSEIEQEFSFSRGKTARIVNHLLELKKIVRTGSARSTRYGVTQLYAE